MSTRPNPMDRHDNAKLPAASDDWADAPIEEWTLDEFDRFADLHTSARGAWAAADDFDA